MLRSPFLLSLLSLLVVPFSAARAQEATAAPEPPPAHSGMVWKVTGGKSDLYLAGSMHLLKPSGYPLPEPYSRAYANSGRVVMEVTPGEMEKPETIRRIVEISMLPGNDLRKRISPETWSELRTWAAGTGVSLDMLQRMKPWMVSLTVAMTAYSKAGYRSDLGIEKHYGERLKKDGKTGEGLETAAFQIGLFDSLDEGLQEKMILQAIREAADITQYAEKLNEAWRAGDPEKLNGVMGESLRKYPDLAKILLTDRNEAWMKRIGELLDGGETVMLLVGAAHLVGPGGVIELLEKKGFRCEQLRAAPAGVEKSDAPAPAKKAA